MESVTEGTWNSSDFGSSGGFRTLQDKRLEPLKDRNRE